MLTKQETCPRCNLLRITQKLILPTHCVLHKPDCVLTIIITLSAVKLTLLRTCWTENIFQLTKLLDHMSRKWADDPSTVFPRCSQTLQPVSWGWQKTPQKRVKRRSVSGHVIIGYWCIFWFRTVNIAVTRSLFGRESSARRSESPSQPLSVTLLLPVHTLLEKCWANTDVQSQRLTLLSH